MKALNRPGRLWGRGEQYATSYEGPRRHGRHPGLKQLKKQKTYGQADASDAIEQATKLFERWKAANLIFRRRERRGPRDEARGD